MNKQEKNKSEIKVPTNYTDDRPQDYKNVNIVPRKSNKIS